MLPGYLSFFCSRCIQRRMINQLVPNISNSLAIPKHFHFSSRSCVTRIFRILPVTFPESFRLEEIHVNFQVFLKSRPDNWFRKHMLFLEDSKVHIQLFRRFLRRFSALYWWIAYPDEFALDNFDVYVGFPESRQSIGSVWVMFPQYVGYEIDNSTPPLGRCRVAVCPWENMDGRRRHPGRSWE